MSYEHVALSEKLFGRRAPRSGPGAHHSPAEPLPSARVHEPRRSLPCHSVRFAKLHFNSVILAMLVVYEWARRIHVPEKRKTLHTSRPLCLLTQKYSGHVKKKKPPSIHSVNDSFLKCTALESCNRASLWISTVSWHWLITVGIPCLLLRLL